MYAKLLDEMRHAKACGLSFKVTTESGSRYVFTPKQWEDGWLYSRIPMLGEPDLVGHLVSRETDVIRVSPSNGRLYVDDIVSTPIMAVEVLG